MQKVNPFIDKRSIFAFLLIVQTLWGQGAAFVFDDSQVARIDVSIDPQYLDYIYDPAHLESDSLFPCVVHFKNAKLDTTIYNVGFRLRGNTSRQAKKKSFKLSFNTFEPGRKFFGLEKLNLNGEHNDPSIIRSKLCWDMFRKIDLHGSRAAHVAVYINEAYYGLYIMVEHVDEQFLKDYFQYPDGNLWKCLWPADLTYRGDEQENYFPYFDEERPYELKTNVQMNDFRPLARLIRILEKTSDEQLVDSLVMALDLKDVLKYFATNLLVGSWDDYWSLMNNYYLYYDYVDQKMHLIPYDYDNTFGIDFFNIDWGEANLYQFPKISDGPRPLAERIMNHPALRNLYSHFLKFYRDSVFVPYLWQAHIDSIKERITPFAERDTFYQKDYGFTVQDFHDSYSAGHYQNQHVKYGLMEFFWRRFYTAGSQIEFLNAAPVIYQVNVLPKLPDKQDSITIEVRAYGNPQIQSINLRLQPGNLTVIEEYPFVFKPLSGSPKVEDHDRWVVTIPPLLDVGFAYFQIKALNAQGQSTYFPARGGIKILTTASQNSSLVINEFMAQNNQAVPDAAGEFDDWLEIYNRGEDAVPLAGLYLTDDPQNLTRWRFPDSTSPLPGHAFRLIWCDDDLKQAGLHASFKLSAGGEFLALVASDGQTIIDSLSFGPQKSDVAFGRFPDGGENWTFMPPTPQAGNVITGLQTLTNRSVQKFKVTAFPNPFNQQIRIRYYLPQAAAVVVEIYNVVGEKIWQKISSLNPAGWHQIIWSGRNEQNNPVASGLYFLRVKTKTYQIQKKLLLIE